MVKTRWKDFPGGWVAGNFDPSIIRTSYFEVGVKDYPPGSFSPKHIHHETTEWTFVLSGQCLINGELVFAGECVEIAPGESCFFESRGGCQTMVVKMPSNPEDKEICHG